MLYKVIMTVLISDILAKFCWDLFKGCTKKWCKICGFFYFHLCLGAGYAQPLPQSMTSDVANAVRESSSAKDAPCFLGICWKLLFGSFDP